MVVVAGCHSSGPGSEAPLRRRKKNGSDGFGRTRWPSLFLYCSVDGVSMYGRPSSSGVKGGDMRSILGMASVAWPQS